MPKQTGSYKLFIITICAFIYDCNRLSRSCEVSIFLKTTYFCHCQSNQGPAVLPTPPDRPTEEEERVLENRRVKVSDRLCLA